MVSVTVSPGWSTVWGAGVWVNTVCTALTLTVVVVSGAAVFVVASDVDEVLGACVVVVVGGSPME
jgi:hypothetical protein